LLIQNLLLVVFQCTQLLNLLIDQLLPHFKFVASTLLNRLNSHRIHL
jgi:hypothetical protein